MLHFHLTVTDQQFPQLKHALDSQGIHFDPDRQLTPAIPEPLHNGIFTGPDGDLAADDLREAFRSLPEAPLLKPYGKLTIHQKGDLLTLASLHCHWTDGTEPEITAANERELAEYVSMNPSAFVERPHP